MDDKREVSEETRNGGANAPFKFFHSSHQIVGSNPSDITAPTDKAVADFVNSSIATNSGRFQGTYETVGDLPLSGVRDTEFLEIPGTSMDVSITETSSFSRKLTLNWSASV